MSFARSRWPSAIGSSSSISSSERIGARVPLCRKRSARDGSERKRRGMHAVRPARRVVSHDRYGPDPDRRHRCHDRDDDPQRSGMGYEQMEDRGPFRFLAAAVSGQSNQRGQDHRERSAANQQPSDHRSKDGGQHLAAKQHLFGSAVSSTQNQARSSRCDQGHGRQAGPTGLPHAPLRDEIRRPRSGVLRGSTSQATNQHLKWKAAKLGYQTMSFGRLKAGRGVSGESPFRRQIFETTDSLSVFWQSVPSLDSFRRWSVGFLRHSGSRASIN